MKGMDIKNEYPVRFIKITRIGCKPQHGFSMTFQADDQSSQACLMSAEASIRSWLSFDSPSPNERLSIQIRYLDDVMGHVTLPFNDLLRRRRFLLSQVVFGYRVNQHSTGFMVGDPLDSEAQNVCASICS